MLTFLFKARNDRGTLISGAINSDSRDSATAALRQKGYYLLELHRQGRAAEFLGRTLALRNRITIRDRAVFTRQLATLLKAGLHLGIALKTLTRQTPNCRLAQVIQQIRTDVEHSSSLAGAMTAHPDIFSAVNIAIIEAAEHSGTLPQALADIAARLKEKARLDSQIRAALAYPIFLLVVSIAIVAALSTLVVPKFVQFFLNTSQQLPLPTKILLAVTNNTKNLWPLLLAIIVTIVLIAVAALKDNKARLALDALILKLPAVGTFARTRQIARFTRTLGSLLKGGVRIIEAVSTAAQVNSNRAFAAQIKAIALTVTKGESLAEAMAQLPAFDEMTASMVAVGEDSGMLPEMLIEIADIYDRQSKDAITAITNMLGPALIVILGLIIGFVVMAILLPIFHAGTIVT